MRSSRSKRSKKGGRSSSKRREKSQEEDVLGGGDELKPDFEAETYSPSRKRANAPGNFEDAFNQQEEGEEGRLN